MTAFNDMLAADASAVFANPAELAESVTYTNASGSHTINATVFRDDVQSVEGISRYNLPAKTLEVFIPIGSISTIDTGFDSISLPERQGGAVVKKKIHKILRQDAGGWLIKLQ